MNLMLLISVAAMALYIRTLWIASASYLRIKPNEHSNKPNEHSVKISLIIPFRNEKRQIPDLLASLSELNTPSYALEIIFCDDHSSDGSAVLIAEGAGILPFSYQIFSLPEGRTGKKEALHMGITAAAADHIVTTDADCRFHPEWINNFIRVFETRDVLLVAAPVRYMSTGAGPVIHAYQAMESAMLMAMTEQSFGQGKALMANGANLAFRKDVYQEAGRMRSDGTLPGGDDIFLLEAVMERHPGKSTFLRSAESTVDTSPEISWNDLWLQRTRWASKVRFQADRSAFVIQTMATLFYGWYVFTVLSAVFGQGMQPTLLMVTGKMLADLLLMRNLLPACGYSIGYPAQCTASVIQPFFSLMVAGRVLFGNYAWKDRKYKG